MKTLTRFLPLALLVVTVVVIIASGVTRHVSLEGLRSHEAALRSFIAAHPIASLVAFAALYALATATSLPGATILTLAGGYLFGTWAGGGATVIGATLGAVIVFLAVRTSLGAMLREKAERSGGRLRAVITGIEAGAFGYILTLRVIPMVPFWLVNIAAGLAGAPMRAYVPATLLGIIPATLIYSGIGSGFGAVIAMGQAPDLGVIFEPKVLLPLLALGGLSLGTTLFQRQRARRGKAT